MRSFAGGTGSRLALVALALGVMSAASAEAAPIIRYNTVGAILADPAKVSGVNVIGFNGVSGGTVMANSSNISLGEFQVIPGLGTDQTVTYSDVPFVITFGIDQIDGATPSPNQTPIEFRGKLNGMITGNSLSTVTATFDESSIPPFITGSFSNILSSLDPVGIVPSTTNSGRSSVQGTINSQPVPIPEPSSVAVFLTLLAGGYGLQRRRALSRAKAA